MIEVVQNGVRREDASKPSFKNHVKDAVEASLQSCFDDEIYPELRQFRGQLSTEPSKVGLLVTSASLHDKCTGIGLSLLQPLRNHGLGADIYFVDGIDGHAHIRVVGNDEKILVDPAIGQILRGHNHVFVGTAEELQELLKHLDGGRYSVVNKWQGVDTSEVFDKVWGSAKKVEFCAQNKT